MNEPQMRANGPRRWLKPLVRLPSRMKEMTRDVTGECPASNKMPFQNFEGCLYSSQRSGENGDCPLALKF